MHRWGGTEADGHGQKWGGVTRALPEIGTREAKSLRDRGIFHLFSLMKH